MSDVTIESISIEITASAENASKALEKLTASLLTLKAACQGGLEGADKTAKALKKIAEAAKSFENIDSDKLKNTAEALNSLKRIGNIGDLSNAAAQINELQKIANAVAAMPSIDTDKISQIQKLGKALTPLSKAFSSLSQIGSLPDFSGLAASIQPLAAAAISINQVDIAKMAANIQQLATALQPLAGMQNRNFSSIINALGKLPNVAKGLSQIDMGTFTRQMQQLAAAIQPLSRQMRSLASSFSGLPAPIQQSIASLMNYNTSVTNADRRTQSLGKSLKLVDFMAVYMVAKRITGYLKGFINASNEYVENLNLFTVTMGDAADEAMEFAERVNEVMGIDISQWIQNQGVFKQLVSGFGMVEEKANLVSKNLTQLGYDISSYFNISVEDAMLKLQSGISGELEPLRRVGYALDTATLQQVAYNHGIEMSITKMSQAQKAQLRYIAIMEQSNNAMGDMARTIESPANQLRILESRIQTLKRAIGDSLMPVVSAALPYITAFVQILGETFRNIAEFMGYELPVFDYSKVLSKNNMEIAESFDEATAASNKFKGTLAGIDQLNIIGSKTQSGGTGDLLGADLDIDLPSYDFLGDLKAETSEAYKTLKEFLANIAPVVGGIAATLGTLFVRNKIISGLKALEDGFNFLTTKPLGRFASGLMATVTAFLGFKNVVKDLTTGNGSLNKLALAISGVVTAVGLFIATKNPLGALFTLIGAGLGAIAGYVDGIKQSADEKAMERITAAFENGVTPISEVADALERVSSDLTSSERTYLNTKDNLKGIADNATSVSSNINSMIRELANTEDFPTDKIDALKDAFEELATSSKSYIEESNNNFKLYILANQDMLKAQGFSVSSMVEIINQGTKNAEDTINSLQARADELLNKTGLSSSEIAELNDINTKLLQMHDIDVDFGVDISGAKSVLENIANIKFENAETAGESLKSAFETVTDAYKTLETAKKEMMKDVDRLALTEGIDESQIKYMREAVNSLFDVKKANLDEAFSKPLQSIILQAKGLYDTIKSNVAKATAEGVEGAFNTPLGIGYWFNSDARASMGGASFEDINKGKVEDILGDYAYLFENPMAALESTFAQKGLSTGTLFADSFVQGLEESTPSVTEKFKDVTDKIKNYQDIVASAKEGGANVGSGIANGLTDSATEVTAAMKGICGAMGQTFKEETDSHSPSKLYAKYGGYLADGIAIGILSKKSAVTSAMDNVLDALEKHLSGVAIKIPVYTEEDVERGLTRTLGGGYSMSPTVQYIHSGTDAEAVTQAGQAWNANGTPLDVNVNVQSYVELDGDQVGEASARYQQRQMAYSNGY